MTVTVNVTQSDIDVSRHYYEHHKCHWYQEKVNPVALALSRTLKHSCMVHSDNIRYLRMDHLTPSSVGAYLITHHRDRWRTAIPATFLVDLVRSW